MTMNFLCSENPLGCLVLRLHLSPTHDSTVSGTGHLGNTGSSGHADVLKRFTMQDQNSQLLTKLSKAFHTHHRSLGEAIKLMVADTSFFKF